MSAYILLIFSASLCLLILTTHFLCHLEQLLELKMVFDGIPPRKCQDTQRYHYIVIAFVICYAFIYSLTKKALCLPSFLLPHSITQSRDSAAGTNTKKTITCFKRRTAAEVEEDRQTAYWLRNYIVNKLDHPALRLACVSANGQAVI